MKKALSLLICVALLASSCLWLTGCGSKEVSGLGQLTMDDEKPGEQSAGGIGTLGQPKATDPPQPTDPPEPVPEGPAPLETEQYSCDSFSVTIPVGWEVCYEVFDSGNGVMRMVINVKDPQDENNRLFYATAMEPFFVSMEAKNAYLPYLPDYFEWSPVLSQGPSAQAVLEQWAAVYTMLESEGNGFQVYFKNYSIQEVLDSAVVDGSTQADTLSGVLARVSIPAATADYGMFYENELVLNAPAQNLPSGAQYYTGYNNYGIVVREDLYEAWMDTLVLCKKSFDFSGFNTQYGVSGSQKTVEVPTGIPLR